MLAQARDVAVARMPVVTEAEMAASLARSGAPVVEHRGRLWTPTLPGFYRPVHLLARLSDAQATRPAPTAWGYQACLADDDARHADAAVPVHLVTDLDAFEEPRLSKSRRRSLRKAREHVRFVELTGAELLLREGYEVLRSAHARSGAGRLPSRRGYEAQVSRLGDPAHGIVIAGLVDGRLAGYTSGHAVDGTAYARDMVVASWALDTGISTGLTYEFFWACRRNPAVREVVDGLHAREDEGLCRYKEMSGIPLRRVPARLWMVPGAAQVLRRLDPHKYYRLSGRG
ncbi:hypothetical protein JKP75_15760 [Blastococcus sp. TML/M2B]|uniref:hypothetical protein n=1 Tax=unclassified Blastococcus TaxID=2619396 RepID=UPI00190DF3EF|nr:MULTISPECIES: hypothetical protein [unclassified Blastococcus]MBN1093880.1 hypothetical protein [Blastococcus sp. TML/M2B]MBN1095999.1 hypothetical protein [Blastococcus sp. TML/C7B]